jgi:hypothetical protein
MLRILFFKTIEGRVRRVLSGAPIATSLDLDGTAYPDRILTGANTPFLDQIHQLSPAGAICIASLGPVTTLGRAVVSAVSLTQSSSSNENQPVR